MPTSLTSNVKKTMKAKKIYYFSSTCTYSQRISPPMRPQAADWCRVPISGNMPTTTAAPLIPPTLWI